MNRAENTQYVLSLSYGKDSMACIEACRLLGYPIDRIITADVWATDTIDADLPPMVEFKAYADQEILRRYGIEVEHTCAMKDGEKLTYEKMFYHIPKRKSKKFENLPKGFPHTINGKTWCKKLKAHESDSGYVPDILGFPMRGGNWCTSLKTRGVSAASRSALDGKLGVRNSNNGVFRYRLALGRHNKYGAVSRNCA